MTMSYWTEPIARSLLDLALQSTVILLLFIPAIFLTRSGSATTRHSLLASVMWGLLLLPALGFVLPRMHLGLFQPGVTAAQVLPESMSVEVKRATPKAKKSSRAKTAGGEVRSSQPARVESRPLSFWLICLWLTGVFLVLVWALLGRINSARLIRGARPVRQKDWQTLFQRLCRQGAYRRKPRLLTTRHVRGPVVIGIFRSCVLIPETALHWPPSRIQAALLHEMAHIKRQDLLHQLVAQLCCALYWFSPLVWLAARKLVIDREIASDDFVLNSGFRASEYARHLMAASGNQIHQNRFPMEVVAMAKGNNFKDRMLSILDEKTNRKSLKQSMTLSLMFVVAGLIAPVAAFSTWGEEPQEAPPAAPSPVSAVIAPVAEPAPVSVPSDHVANVIAPVAPTSQPVLAPAPNESPEPVPSADVTAPEPVLAPVPVVPSETPVVEPAPASEPRPNAIMKLESAPKSETSEPAVPSWPAMRDTPDQADTSWSYEDDIVLPSDDEDVEDEAEAAREEELEERLEKYEELIEEVIEAAEERIEASIEFFEEHLENWEEEMEDSMGEKQSEALEEKLEVIEDKADDFEEKLDEVLEGLEDKFDFDVDDLDNFPTEDELGDMVEEVKIKMADIDQMVKDGLKSLTEEFEQLKKQY